MFDNISAKRIILWLACDLARYGSLSLSSSIHFPSPPLKCFTCLHQSYLMLFKYVYNLLISRLFLISMHLLGSCAGGGLRGLSGQQGEPRHAVRARARRLQPMRLLSFRAAVVQGHLL